MAWNEQQGTYSAMLASLALLFVLVACSDGSDNRPDISQKRQADNPVVEGPISGGGAEDCCTFEFPVVGFVDLRDMGYVPGTPFYSAVEFDEADVGYREKEYFFSGTATSYIATDELTSDGIWNIQPADAAEYRSRIVVQRPIEDAAFNGTVVVEWFNVTAGLDASPDWLALHTELMREGYAWVGVSAQSVGIEGGGLVDLSLKAIDSDRYGRLSHPGDSFSYDIFSQAAQAVRNPVGLDPLEGLKVKSVIGVGQSQSASRLSTYVNAVHPTIDLFDGFLVHSRGRRSSALSQEPQVEIPTPEVVMLRDDLAEPIIMLQAESDLSGLGLQPDSAKFRLWEVAGSAHSDAYSTVKAQHDKGDDPAVADVIENAAARPPIIDCNIAVNDGPMHWVAKAAIAALERWITEDESAPMAPGLQLNPEGTGFVLDDLGNALGGIRTPYVDAPVAVLSGFGNSGGLGLCGLFGTTKLFDDATMFGLYPSREAYVKAIDEATDAATDAGFLVPADAALIKERARASGLGGE